MSCQFSGRHLATVTICTGTNRNTGYYKQERNISQTDSDSQEKDFQDGVSTTLTEEFGSSTTTDSETEEKMDP